MAARILKIFEDDWKQALQEKTEDPKAAGQSAAKTVKRFAKAMTRSLPPVAPVLEMVARETMGENVELDIDVARMEKIVRSAVKEAVEESVREAIHEMVDQDATAVK